MIYNFINIWNLNFYLQNRERHVSYALIETLVPLWRGWWKIHWKISQSWKKSGKLSIAFSRCWWKAANHVRRYVFVEWESFIRHFLDYFPILFFPKGNVAWAFICAKNTLRKSPDSVAGLPITITDDTPIIDVLRFCQKMSKDSKNCITPSAWNIPTLISYFCGWIVEIAAQFCPGLFSELPVNSITFFPVQFYQ